MLLGAGLAVVVLLLFLRHGRITAISATAIPLTLAITVFVMSLLGQTFNLMTLGAMAIAIGLVIDDAVVITENIARHLALPGGRLQAIRAAVQELIWPVTTSTLTTVVVFLPLGLLQGVVGQFFAALATTLTVAVLVSLGLALTIIPLLAERFVTAHEVEAARTGLLARVQRALDALAPAYERALVACCTTRGGLPPRRRCWWSPESGCGVSWAPGFCRKWTRARSCSTTGRRGAPPWTRPTAK